MSTVFVLTREINQYDQDGEYFVAVFAKKPTREQLLAHGVSEKYVEHTLMFGGRSADYEYEWFHIREVEAK